MAGTRGDTINQLASNYLAAGLSALSAGVQAEAASSIMTSNSNDVLAVVLSSLAIFVIFFLVYRPLIARLDLEMKQSRTLLLLVPDEVAKAVPAVIMAAQKLAQFAQTQ
jgi:flagellar biosynthesis/type III secretory pathway M-ring protein FliF/YscJ